MCQALTLLAASDTAEGRPARSVAAPPWLIRYTVQMTMFDRILERFRCFLVESDAGISVWRSIRWAVPLVAPYTPPRNEIPPERARAFVKVEVRPSTIPGAGQGLFAMERIEAGVTIGEYTGDIVDSVFKVLRLPNKDYVALTSNPAISIDALRRPEAMMRYICHHPKEERRNVRYRSDGSRKFLETIRPVDPGQEFLADYSDVYWRLRGITPNGN
jgi:hypothetical protein